MFICTTGRADPMPYAADWMSHNVLRAMANIMYPVVIMHSLWTLLAVTYS